MNNDCFANTLIEYLPDSLRSKWAHMKSKECELYGRLLLEKAPESDWVTQRALGWLKNAQYSADPNAIHVAARMMASVVMMMADVH
jgi:hypothetical protein